ncbi:MAG: single-stranded DNA-binding protein [Blastocatellia bacterium]|nr:single-stranded DNA-binding protein [Blastocatellia bacterium]
MSTTISILGNTGRDVELRYTPNGTPVANFSIASNTVRNTAQGKQKRPIGIMFPLSANKAKRWRNTFPKATRFSFAAN